MIVTLLVTNSFYLFPEESAHVAGYFKSGMSPLSLDRKIGKIDCGAFGHKLFLSFSRKAGSCSWIL
jgi:hypothetical protein